MTTSAGTLKQTLQHDLTEAMRARDQVRVATLRMALTSVTNAETAGTEHRELTDDDVLAVLTKESKRRTEAATAFRAADRPELAEKEEAEQAVLADYLPAALTDEQVAGIVDAAIADTGATGMAQMGAVMRLVQPQIVGRADGTKVAALVRARLG